MKARRNVSTPKAPKRLPERVPTRVSSAPGHGLEPRLYRKMAEWQYVKEKVLFFFELAMVCLLVGVCIFIIAGPSQWPLKLSAAAALWGTARAIRKHLLDTR